MINETEDEKKSDKENEQGKHFAQNVRNGCLPLLLEVKIPEIMIGQCDDESRTEQDEGSADVLTPIGLDAINGDGDIEGEGETENLGEESKRHLRAPFKETAEGQRNEVGEDKRDDGGGSALRTSEGLDHRYSILPINSQWNKQEAHLSRCGRSRKPLKVRETVNPQR